MAETVSDPAEITLEWSGRAVDAARIEAELAKLRHYAAGQPSQGEGFALRTSLLNLVIYAEDEEAAQEAGRVIAGLSSHHASRALILIARHTEVESRIDAQLTAHCHIAPGLDQQVCCEEVTLTVNGPAARHLHSVIIPLLVPDLPVYVWWPGQLPDDHHTFDEVLETADQLIVDSGHFSDQAGGLARLAGLVLERGDPPIGDLNWERLQPWRQLLAEYCQAAPSRQPLTDVRSVKIGFARGGGEASSQALLLLGWLASLFGWDAVVSRRDTAVLHQDGHRVSVEMRSREYAGLDPGWLVSVSLRGTAEAGDASLSISRIGDPLHLVVHVQEPGRVFEEQLRIDPCGPGEMLMQQLDRPRDNPEYEAALERVLPLIRASGPRR